MKFGQYIEVTRGNKADGRLPGLSVHRFYVVTARDRHKAPYVEVGLGERVGPFLVVSKHHFRVTLGDYSVRSALNVERKHGRLDGAVGRIWFEGGLGRIRGLRDRLGV